MTQAVRDENRVVGLIAETDDTSRTPTPLIVDPTTKRLKIASTALENTPTTFGSGQTTVTTAGTRVQLATNSCLAVTIKAKTTNMGLIYVGTSTITSSNGFILSAGESVDIAISNTDKIYIDSSVNSEGISFAFVEV